MRGNRQILGAVRSTGQKARLPLDTSKKLADRPGEAGLLFDALNTFFVPQRYKYSPISTRLADFTRSGNRRRIDNDVNPTQRLGVILRIGRL